MDGPREAISLQLARTGQAVESVSDGENTDDRANWIVPIVRRRQAHPEVLVLRADRFDEVPMRLTHAPVCVRRPYRGTQFREQLRDVMGLRYAHYALAAYPILESEIRTRTLGVWWRNNRSPRLQVDVPGPFDLAAMTWGLGALAHMGDEITAAAAEISEITQALGADNVVFQLSLPVETYLVTRAGKARARVARWCARWVTRFVMCCPPESRWIVHLCVGDPHGRPLVELRDVDPLVVLTSAISNAWPSGRVLDAVHWPLSNGRAPAPSDEEFYAPATEVDQFLPQSVHLSAGLAHMDATLGYQKRCLQLAEDTTGRELGVSTPCGLGRRPEQVEALMARMMQLATGVTVPW